MLELKIKGKKRKQKELYEVERSLIPSPDIKTTYISSLIN